ncbi:DNA gyrase inhibitor YacG [Phenylobacterium sp. SCN 70-31]|uniref:DNA gyrase inhibitor YacG n=1 Tax=Phenylobacterium sp. SCN 70-31 TaxID=1660129 RepID=UPI0025E126B4|nr:DNA gyrase inhibitor YacG [Phenylobacterium sp. SCN 70-31]
MSGACPICGKPPLSAYRPFCSKRCANVDLHRWLTGAYAVPAQEDESGPSDDFAGDFGDD